MPVRPTTRQLADRREVVRELLRKYPDGLSDKHIAKRADIRLNLERLNLMLMNMGDLRIVAWVPGSPKRPWRPVWRLFELPPHCPKPTEM